MQGRADYPLSERGGEQARLLSRWVRHQGLSWEGAYCSPLLRARQTAEQLCAGSKRPAPVTEPELVEIGAGRLEGLDAEQLRARHPGFFERKVGDTGDFSAFGGESYTQVQQRLERLIDRLVERHGAQDAAVLLVGHGGLNFQLLKRLVCQPVPPVCLVRMGNCSATLVRMSDRRGTYLGELVWHVPIELMGGEAGEGIGAVFH